MKKSRQVEYQKLQRKDRKERRDIEKFTRYIKQLEDQLIYLNPKDNCKKQDDTTLEFETSAPTDLAMHSKFSAKKIAENTGQCENQSDVLVTLGNEESTNPVRDLSEFISKKKTPIQKNSKLNQIFSGTQKTGEITESTKVNLSASDSDATKVTTSGISEATFNEGEK